MPNDNIKLDQIVARLESIQREVDSLLGQLRPVAENLHKAEDSMLESVFGEQNGPATPPPQRMTQR